MVDGETNLKFSETICNQWHRSHGWAEGTQKRPVRWKQSAFFESVYLTKLEIFALQDIYEILSP